MPIYDLQCNKCGQILPDYGLQGETEVVQKCPCGSTDLRKMVSRVAVRFRGEGFATKQPAETEESE